MFLLGSVMVCFYNHIISYKILFFNLENGVDSFTHPLYPERIFELTWRTNINKLGAYVYRIDGSEIFDPGSKGPQHYYNYCIWSVYYIINIL